MNWVDLDGQETFFENPKHAQFMPLEEMREHEWDVSWSGGKDSTATIIKMREKGIPIRKITYVRMMWDENLPATLPVMTDFVDHAAEIIRGWGYDLQIIPSWQSAKEIAEKIIEHPKKEMRRKGHHGGIAQFLRGSCRFSGVKIETIKRNSIKDAWEMIGYCIDETSRIHRLGGKKQSILCTLGITEVECFDICEEYGLLSPLYALNTGRDGCWFCPNTSKRERETEARTA